MHQIRTSCIGVIPIRFVALLTSDLERSPSISAFEGTTAFPAPLALSRTRIPPSHNSGSPAMPSTRVSSIGGCRSSQGSPTLFVGRTRYRIFQGGRSRGRSSRPLSVFLVVSEGAWRGRRIQIRSEMRRKGTYLLNHLPTLLCPFLRKPLVQTRLVIVK